MECESYNHCFACGTDAMCVIHTIKLAEFYNIKNNKYNIDYKNEPIHYEVWRLQNPQFFAEKKENTDKTYKPDNTDNTEKECYHCWMRRCLDKYQDHIKQQNEIKQCILHQFGCDVVHPL